MAISTEGSVDNLARLRSRATNLELVLADVAERDPAAGRHRRTVRGRPCLRELPAGRSFGTRRRLDLEDLDGKSVLIRPPGSGAAATSTVLFDAAGLGDHIEMLRLRLRDGPKALTAGSVVGVGVVGRRSHTGDL